MIALTISFLIFLPARIKISEINAASTIASGNAFVVLKASWNTIRSTNGPIKIREGQS
jgi:hypothetical protein